MTPADLVNRYEQEIRKAIQMDGLGHRTLAKRLTELSGVYVTMWKARKVREIIGLTPTPPPSADKRQQISRTAPDAMTQTLEAKGGRIRTLADLLDAAGVDLTQWKVETWKANAYEQAQKGEDGPRLITLHQVKATLRRHFSATLRPARAPVTLPPPEDVERPPAPFAVFIPDTQVGHRFRNRWSYLDPMHDRAAMDCVVRALKRMDPKPQVVCLLGDMADLASLSRYPSDISLRGTTQATIDELHWWLAQIRLAVGGATRIVYMSGNHEKRLEVSMIPSDLEGLVAAKEEDPLLTLRRLLRLDELRIEYVGPYGADWWLWDGKVQVTHGNTVRSGGGATAASVVKGLTSASQVFGHIHRLELACRTVHGPDGEQVLVALSPGCLCRLSGGDGPPGFSDSGRDWQQGIGVAYLHEDRVHMSTVPIHAGSLVWEGEIITGRDRVEELIEATGWEQFRG